MDVSFRAGVGELVPFLNRVMTRQEVYADPQHEASRSEGSMDQHSQSQMQGPGNCHATLPTLAGVPR